VHFLNIILGLQGCKLNYKFLWNKRIQEGGGGRGVMAELVACLPKDLKVMGSNFGRADKSLIWSLLKSGRQFKLDYLYVFHMGLIIA
jgi:hypothetical protein